MESSRLSVCLSACLVVCFACSLTAFAAAPTRMGGPEAVVVPGPAQQRPETNPSVPQKEQTEKDGAVVPTNPSRMQDEAAKSYMPVVSAVPQKEKEGQSQGRVIVLPEKQRRRIMPSQVMPRETMVFKEEDSKMYMTPEKENVYQLEPKPVMVEEEETYYPKTYLKTVTPKVAPRSPMKVQHETEKMEITENVEAPTKTYVVVQAMGMEEQVPSVIVQSMAPMDSYPTAKVAKKPQDMKVPQMREDMEAYESYTDMKMKMEKAHQQHSDCGGVPCYMPEQMCEVPPCKVPSVCPDCASMKVVPSSAPVGIRMPHDKVEKVQSGFIQRYVDNKQNMIVTSPTKVDKEQAPRFYKQAPCVYGTDCVMRQYEEDAVNQKPSVSACMVDIHRMSPKQMADCSTMASSYSGSPARGFPYSAQKEQMGSPSGSAPAYGWAMPSMPMPVHESERMPVPVHPPQGDVPAEEWKMPAVPPMPATGSEMGMPWAKSGPSAPQEKTPEGFGRRYHYYSSYCPGYGCGERAIVYYPSNYSPRVRYESAPVSYYTVPATAPVEYISSPTPILEQVYVPQRPITYVRGNSKVKQTMGEEYYH